MRRAFLRSLDVSLLVYVPVVLGVAATADQLVPLLYGERWSPASVYLKLLCWGVVLQPVTHLHSSLIKALGRPGLRLAAEFIVSPVTLVALWVASGHGVTAVVATAVLRGWLWVAVLAAFSARLLPFPPREQWARVGRILLVGAVTYIAVDRVGACVPVGRLPLFLLQAALGALLYLGLARLVCGAAMREAFCSLSFVAPEGVVRAAGRLLLVAPPNRQDRTG
jgi:O-antigen/teichoic acid export membrane protein